MVWAHKWYFASGKTKDPLIYRRHNHTPTMVPYNILFPNRLQTIRLITANTAEHTDHHPLDEYNHKQIVSRFPTVPPSFAAVGWDTEWIDELPLPDVPCHIYVDGSWEASPHTTTLEWLMRGTHEPTGSCAVVFIPKT